MHIFFVDKENFSYTSAGKKHYLKRRGELGRVGHSGISSIEFYVHITNFTLSQPYTGYLTSKLNFKTVPVYLLLTLLLYFFSIFYLPRCHIKSGKKTLPEFAFVSSPAFFPYLSCCHLEQLQHWVVNQFVTFLEDNLALIPPPLFLSGTPL